MSASQSQTATRQFRVTLAGKPMNLGGLGRVGTGWQSPVIDAASAQDAIDSARVICRDTFDSTYAEGRATVVEIHTYHVTLRGRSDKRRRETFIARGENESKAIQMLSYQNAPRAFAGWFDSRKRDAIVKVEQAR